MSQEKTPLPVYIPEMTLDLVNKQREQIENDAHEIARILGHLMNLRQAARRVVYAWGSPDDPLIDPDMGAAIDALWEAIEATKPPFPGGKT